MALEFTKLSEVPVTESLDNDATIIVEQGSEIKRISASALCSAGGSTSGSVESNCVYYTISMGDDPNNDIGTLLNAKTLEPVAAEEFESSIENKNVFYYNYYQINFDKNMGRNLHKVTGYFYSGGDQYYIMGYAFNDIQNSEIRRTERFVCE